MPETGRAEQRRHHLPAIGGYVVLTTAVLWPAVAHFRTRSLTGSGDSSVFAWAWWAMPRAVARGDNPYATDLLFHPVGADLSLTTTTPLIALVTGPVRVLLGPAAQINLVQLSAFFAAALGAYLLTHRIIRHRGASFIAGLVFAAAPYRFVQLREHLNLIHTWVLPFGVLAFLWFVDRPSVRRAVGFGAVLGSTFLVEPQLTILLLLALACLAVAHRRAVRANLRLLALSAAVAVGAALPLLAPMLSAVLDGELDPRPGAEAAVVYSATAASWVTHPASHPFLGALAERSPPAPTLEAAAAPGLLVLVLAVVGARLVPGVQRRGFVVLTLTAILLSFGPYPTFLTDARVPLPYQLFQLVPGLDAVRVPGRFAILGVLGTAVLAAGTIAALSARLPRRGALVVLACGAVAAFELIPGPLPEGPGAVPTPYEAIASAEGDGAVLDLPLQWSTGQQIVGDTEAGRNNSVYMVYATVHGRPLVGGSVSRYASERLDALKQIPVYRQVMTLAGEPGFEDRPTFGPEQLADLGIGFVVYHRDRPLPRTLAYLQTLDLTVLADDGTVIVWTVPEPE